MNYVEHHFGDYAKDTAHLSMIEHGAYRLLIDVYYVREKPLPSAVIECCRLVRASKAPEKKAVEAVLKEYFDLTSAGWTHKRCEHEIARYRDKQEKAKRSAAARWNSSEEEADFLCEGNANAFRTQCEGNAPSNQKPVTTKPNEKKTTRNGNHVLDDNPLDVDRQIWADWKVLRKQKRAPITATAIAGVRREAAKAGISFEAALALACERGWQGFNAEWVAAESRKHEIDWDALVATAKAREANAH